VRLEVLGQGLAQVLGQVPAAPDPFGPLADVGIRPAGGDATEDILAAVGDHDL
jgi:hypothetical protein